jgi:hypothetical protein
MAVSFQDYLNGLPGKPAGNGLNPYALRQQGYMTAPNSGQMFSLPGAQPLTQAQQTYARMQGSRGKRPPKPRAVAPPMAPVAPPTTRSPGPLQAVQGQTPKFGSMHLPTGSMQHLNRRLPWWMNQQPQQPLPPMQTYAPPAAPVGNPFLPRTTY